jgi:hypothetical protein
MPDWTTSEWAAVIAAISAAVAAIAAWLATGVSLALHKASQVPHLSAGVIYRAASGELQASFANGGPGLATQVVYFVVCGNAKAGGFVGEGHLHVGEKRVIDLPLPSVTRDEKVYMVWSCRDSDNNVHLWSSDWRYKRIRHRRYLRQKDFSLGAMFRSMYPDIAIPK